MFIPPVSVPTPSLYMTSRVTPSSGSAPFSAMEEKINILLAFLIAGTGYALAKSVSIAHALPDVYAINSFKVQQTFLSFLLQGGWAEYFILAMGIFGFTFASFLLVAFSIFRSLPIIVSCIYFPVAWTVITLAHIPVG